MTSVTTKPDSSHPAAASADNLFDNWFDPIETEVRARAREFIEELIRGELDAALSRPRPAAVAVTHSACACFITGLPTSPVTRACQCGVKLVADQFFDEIARASPNLGLDRIKPIVEKTGYRLINRLHGIGVRSMAAHGVVSGPALQRRMIRG